MQRLHSEHALLCYTVYNQWHSGIKRENATFMIINVINSFESKQLQSGEKWSVSLWVSCKAQRCLHRNIMEFQMQFRPSKDLIWVKHNAETCGCMCRHGKVKQFDVVVINININKVYKIWIWRVPCWFLWVHFYTIAVIIWLLLRFLQYPCISSFIRRDRPLMFFSQLGSEFSLLLMLHAEKEAMKSWVGHRNTTLLHENRLK